MGVTLFDQKTDAILFDINFWHWRAIVETVRRLRVLPDARVNGLHAPFIGELGEDETHLIGRAIEENVLPTLDDMSAQIRRGES